MVHQLCLGPYPVVVTIVITITILILGAGILLRRRRGRNHEDRLRSPENTRRWQYRRRR
jgi:hypothetical protein